MEWLIVVMMIYLVCLAGTWYAYQRKFAILRKKHEDFCKKSSLEIDISLATTDQLMQEVQSRVPGFILIMPLTPTNNQNLQEMKTYVKGMPPQVAIMCMKMACQAIATVQPDESDE